jgi:hypothetical protein
MQATFLGLTSRRHLHHDTHRNQPLHATVLPDPVVAAGQWSVHDASSTGAQTLHHSELNITEQDQG